MRNSSTAKLARKWVCGSLARFDLVCVCVGVGRREEDDVSRGMGTDVGASEDLEGDMSDISVTDMDELCTVGSRKEKKLCERECLCYITVSLD
jgi:hypothetical protein